MANTEWSEEQINAVLRYTRTVRVQKTMIGSVSLHDTLNAKMREYLREDDVGMVADAAWDWVILPPSAWDLKHNTVSFRPLEEQQHRKARSS